MSPQGSVFPLSKGYTAMSEKSDTTGSTRKTEQLISLGETASNNAAAFIGCFLADLIMIGLFVETRHDLELAGAIILILTAACCMFAWHLTRSTLKYLTVLLRIPEDPQ